MSGFRKYIITFYKQGEGGEEKEEKGADLELTSQILGYIKTKLIE